MRLCRLHRVETTANEFDSREHGERGEPVFAGVVAAGDVGQGGGGVFVCGVRQGSCAPDRLRAARPRYFACTTRGSDSNHRDARASDRCDP